MLSLLVILCVMYSNIVIAGGDPNVKDKNVSKSKSNIKQHDHKKVYNKKNIENIKTTNKPTTKKTEGSNEKTDITGFAAIEDEPLIVDLSSVVDNDGMGSVSVQWQISESGHLGQTLVKL